MKKGVELSLNVIIIAVIALVILVILIYLVSTGVLDFNEQKNDCETLGGSCESSCNGLIPLPVDCPGSSKCCSSPGAG